MSGFPTLPIETIAANVSRVGGVYVVEKDEGTEPVCVFSDETLADEFVDELKRGGTLAWTTYQPFGEHADSKGRAYADEELGARDPGDYEQKEGA